MEKVKLQDKGIIALPNRVRRKFGLEKGMEFDLFIDADTIYLKRVFTSLKKEPFREIAAPFREMSKKEKLKPADVIEEIRKYREKV